MSCLECGKGVPRGRKLSHTCSFNCGRRRRTRLNLNLKRRKESTLKKAPNLTEEFSKKFTGFFDTIFGVK